MTAYWEKRVLDSVFRGETFTVDNTYVGLAVSGADSNPYVELVQSDYARKGVTWSPAEDDGTIRSANQIMWSPTTNWGTIPYVFLSDVAQGGEMLLVTSLGVNSGAGSKIVIEIGDLYVT